MADPHGDRPGLGQQREVRQASEYVNAHRPQPPRPAKDMSARDYFDWVVRVCIEWHRDGQALAAALLFNDLVARHEDTLAIGADTRDRQILRASARHGLAKFRQTMEELGAGL